MNLIGLDLSLTATGVCTGADDARTISVKSKGMRRLVEIREALCSAGGLAAADLVVIEGYSYASGHQAHQMGELGGWIRLNLHMADIPYVEVAPATLKKFATGKGNAGKDQMVATAARSGCPADDNNAVDAWWLYQMALYWFVGRPYGGGCDIPRTAYRDEAVAKIEWPVLA